MNLLDIKKRISVSAFNKQKYTVNLPVKSMIRCLLDYVGDDINPISDNVLLMMVPEFQRANDKWSVRMQKSFVENVIKGFRTTIQIYTTDKIQIVDCKILDGLQRVTALMDFIDGKFKIFNNEVQFSDIENNILRGLTTNIGIEVFTFDNQNDVIDFYVEMNENITHSSDDIQKALSFKVYKNKGNRNVSN